MRWVRAVCVLVAVAGAGGAEGLVLEFAGRYECQRGEPDHLLDATAVGGCRVVVMGNRGLALLDVCALPPQGTRDFVARLAGLNARNAAWDGADHLFVNLSRGESRSSPGFAVVRLAESTMQAVATIDEPGVIYEKLALVEDLLFVAAHAKGVRVFDVADRERPRLVGRLDAGFVDAFAVAVEGDRLWVADGGGGLKLVDVSDPTRPRLVSGETATTATGTAEDVEVRHGTVFVAAGGAGLAVYPNGDLDRRLTLPVGACAKDLAWVGGLLAVATVDGVTLVDPAAAGGPAVVGREVTGRRNGGTLRLCEGVAATADGLLLAANWNWLDVYRPLPAESSSQPDITASRQRIRFPPSGGVAVLTVRNDGGADLEVRGVTTSTTAFAATPLTTSLAPGTSAAIEVTATGAAGVDGDVVLIHSNDPDEDPLPVQVFAATEFLDSGETMPDFTLPAYRRDASSGELVESRFTLSDHRGRVVWLQVYASW